MNQKLSAFFFVSIVLMFAVSACGGSAPAATPTVQPTDMPAPTATNTSVPTATPRPTATPNLAATQEVQDGMERIQGYVDLGYFSSAEGRFFTLNNSTTEMAKINYLSADIAGYEDPVKNFAVWANIKWSNAGTVNPPEYSGCGFLYRYDESSGNYYSVMITKESILMTYCVSSLHACGRVGKTRGTGKVSYGNPAEAKLEMAVNENHAYVLVDGNFIGEYTLFTEKLMEPGYLAYSIVSGTNKDYGTRCEFTNAHLWTPNE